MKPFLKWAGGKQWLAEEAPNLRPPRFKRYFEPFLGGGSFYLALRPERAVLSDNNTELIATYEAVAASPDLVIRSLSRLSYDRETFYRQRGARPRTAHGRAARFIYLNRTAWNGLYRVNRSGGFNVPFGDFRSDPLASIPARIRAASALFRRATLRACDFEVALDEVRSGDFVFIDPPYVSSHKDNGFLRYNARVFRWSDQVRLSAAIERLTRQGASVLLTNADHRSISSLYAGLHARRVSRRSAVAGSTAYRQTVTELLLSNYLLNTELR